MNVGINGTPTQRNDLTDACPLGANVHCDSTCSPHHKDTYYISNMLYDEITSENEIITFWTNQEPNTYCDHCMQILYSKLP